MFHLVKPGPSGIVGASGGDPPEERNPWGDKKSGRGHYASTNKNRSRSVTKKKHMKKRRKSRKDISRSTTRCGRERCDRESCKTKSAHELAWEEEVELLRQGVNVVAALNDQVDYSPPNCAYDSQVEAESQLAVDQAVYAHEIQDEDRLEMPTLAGDMVANNGMVGVGGDNDDQEIINVSDESDVPDLEEVPQPFNVPDMEEMPQPLNNPGAGDNIANIIIPQADVMVVAADNPLTHSRIFYSTNSWVTQVESRSPTLTDLMEEYGYPLSLGGRYRVPWTHIWHIVAQANLGVNGWGYSVIHMEVVFHNDGYGPI